MGKARYSFLPNLHSTVLQSKRKRFPLILRGITSRSDKMLSVRTQWSSCILGGSWWRKSISIYQLWNRVALFSHRMRPTSIFPSTPLVPNSYEWTECLEICCSITMLYESQYIRFNPKKKTNVVCGFIECHNLVVGLSAKYNAGSWIIILRFLLSCHKPIVNTRKLENTCVRYGRSSSSFSQPVSFDVLNYYLHTRSTTIECIECHIILICR